MSQSRPPYVQSSSVYAAKVSAGINTTPNNVNDYVCVPVDIPDSGKVITGVQIGGVTVVGANVICGLCDSNGNRLGITASTALVAGGGQRIPFAGGPVTVDRGKYFLEMVFSSSAPTVLGAYSEEPSTYAIQGSFALPASPIALPTTPGVRASMLTTY